jgi:DNA ligase (NAD+)
MDYIKHPNARFEKIERLDKNAARKQITALREAIDHFDYYYYVKNSPKASDATYDKLFHRLEDLENTFPDLQQDNSPTRRVGSRPVSGLEKVRHTVAMLSLNSALEERDVRSFDRFVRQNADIGDRGSLYVVEPKFDGLSVELVYRNGRFDFGATRGDGTTGEDISQNLRTIKAVPLRLHGRQVPSFLSVRGEVLFSRTGFQRVNRTRVENGNEPFANPRNAAAGLVRQLDSRIVAKAPLDIFFYDILQSSDDGHESHWDVLKSLADWGLKTHESRKRCDSVDDIQAFRDELERKRDGMDYEIDGVVIKVDNLAVRDTLGVRQRSPRWAFAWKFPPKKEVTVLRDIVVQVGRTGILTPVGLLDPVDIGGVTVSRATLHNEDEVHKKDVRPGDRVRVMRAGDVIPEIAERIEGNRKRRSKAFSMPRTCPSCGGKVVREGAYHLCTEGLRCPAQLAGRLTHYASRSALDITTLGEKNVKQLIGKGMVHTIADLYTLTPEQLRELDGFAEKSARKLHRAIQESKKPPLDRFLYGLGIRHVGEHMARVLARRFGSIDALANAKKKEIEETEEIGGEIAGSVAEFFSDRNNRELLDRLGKLGVSPGKVRQKRSGKLEGKTIVVTGELDHFSRQEAKERIEMLGGHAASSVSGNTDLLVTGRNPGGKLNEAQKRKVKVVDERRFLELVGR